ncbi:MAG: hypothetical protein ACYCST_20940 [Acidimicrobiales bacterium]
MATFESEKTTDLPPDNVSRVAIYDALHQYSSAKGVPAITDDELFERVIGRLRVLVPRELHLAGERPYVEEKLKACVEAGLVSMDSDNGRKLLALTGKPPLVRYPDGEVRDYSPGLELARERLDRDNARLRTAGFDVRRFLPSAADDPDGPAFQGLLKSMREHGFLKQFPVVRYDDDVVVDGLARLRAAAILDLDVEYVKYGSERERTAARRRDNPLNRVLIAVHSNLGRLSPDVVHAVYEQVAGVTRRAWDETASDLALTEMWRRTMPAEYSPVFDVKKLPFREGGEAKIQVTADNKVMLRSLVEAGGLSSYKVKILRDYMPFERARSAQTAGPKADFARAEDLISGIAAMQQDRRKVDPEWVQIRGWLVSTFGSQQG